MTPEDSASLIELQRRYDSLSELLRTSGWTDFVAVYEAAEHQHYDLMMRATSPHDAAKFMGALHAIRSFRTWPTRELAVVKAEIEARKAQM